ncbi:MAG: hypothetical protein DRP12_01395 [Candidatus Aenigmatarchaeota archaeon]|nr:MAG: hypothetical protein DRP12_01395 [Candidatus Aenigmarchaeota archaeon]
MKRFLFLFILLLPVTHAYTCAVYFTGVGCPHCAKTDPFIFSQVLKKHPDLVIIEYEIYQQQENSVFLMQYADRYGTGLGIPLIIFSNKSIIGDIPILENLEKTLEEVNGSPCPLLDGQVPFEEVEDLPGSPKIWAGDRVLIRTGEKPLGNYKELLFSDLSQLTATEIDPQPVPISGSWITFDHAVQLDGWVLEWRQAGKQTVKNCDQGIQAQSYLILGLVIAFLFILLSYLLRKKKIKNQKMKK